MSDIIEPLRFFNVQKVLPAVYGDELSYYELLSKMEKKINEEVGAINDQNIKLALMKEIIDDFTEGGYKDDFEQFLDTWFAENMDTIEQYLQDGFGGELDEIRESITTTQEQFNGELDGVRESITTSQEQTLETVNGELTEIRESIITSKEQTLDTVAEEYVPFPVAPASKYGTDGQVLRSNGDGTTLWQAPIIPTDQQAETYINAWLNAHPEATTAVADGSLTTAKYANDSITDEKLVQSGGVLDKVDDLRNDLGYVEEVVSGRTERYSKLSIVNQITVSDTHEIGFEQGDVLNFLVNYEDSGNVSNNRYSVLVYNGTTLVVELRQTLGTVITWEATSNVTKLTFYIQLINATPAPYTMNSVVNVGGGLVEEIELVRKSIEDIFPITNLIDTNDPDYEENKAIQASTGNIISSQFFNATGFIKLKPNTKYYVGGLYLYDNYAFLNDSKSAVITAPTIHVVPSLIYPQADYHGWFETGNAVCYFRGSILKVYSAIAYLSEYYDEYRARTQDCVIESPSFHNLVTDYMGKKVLIVGDSISTGPSSARLNSNLPSYANYDKWVDDLINIGYLPAETTYNCSQHATGFVAKAGQSSWIEHSDFLNRINILKMRAHGFRQKSTLSFCSVASTTKEQTCPLAQRKRTEQFTSLLL